MANTSERQIGEWIGGGGAKYPHHDDADEKREAWASLAERLSVILSTLQCWGEVKERWAMDRQIAWVKLAKYVEITGDSADAVRGRRKLGKWLDGNECKIVDGNLWVNLPAVEQWVENWGRPPPRGAGKGTQ